MVYETKLMPHALAACSMMAVLHIIQCDAGIQSDIKITDPQHLNDMLQNFDVSGNGDTDFRPVFDYIEQLQQRGELLQLQGLLFFTDGVGVYPKKRPAR